MCHQSSSMYHAILISCLLSRLIKISWICYNPKIEPTTCAVSKLSHVIKVGTPQMAPDLKAPSTVCVHF